MLRTRSLAEGGLTGCDKSFEAAVEPSRGHRGPGVRGRAQLVPVPGVARERPTLHERGNRKLVLQIRHALTRARCPPCEAAPSIFRPRRARRLRSRRAPWPGPFPHPPPAPPPPPPPPLADPPPP